MRFSAIDEEEVAVFVDAPEIAGAQEALAVERDEGSSAFSAGLFQYASSTCGPCTTISPTAPCGNSASVSGSMTRESVSNTGMPRHCCFGRSPGFMCDGAIVSVMP